jgi:MerR family mercuric resistance operon transcriptional regulator
MKKPDSSLTATMTIGALARTAGVNVETIRYYQRIGLIIEPPKPPQGYRHYPLATAHRIMFIKRAQELGFTLSEVADLLSLNERECKEARIIAENKYAAIQQRINDLTAMQIELGRLIKSCRENRENQDHCAIIETLTRSLSKSRDRSEGTPS